MALATFLALNSPVGSSCHRPGEHRSRGQQLSCLLLEVLSPHPFAKQLLRWSRGTLCRGPLHVTPQEERWIPKPSHLTALGCQLLHGDLQQPPAQSCGPGMEGGEQMRKRPSEGSQDPSSTAGIVSKTSTIGECKHTGPRSWSMQTCPRNALEGRRWPHELVYRLPGIYTGIKICFLFACFHCIYY